MCFQVVKDLYCDEATCPDVVSRGSRHIKCAEAKSTPTGALGSCRAGVASYPGRPSRGAGLCPEHQQQSHTQQSPGGQQQ